jgi:hypothetical protein
MHLNESSYERYYALMPDKKYLFDHFFWLPWDVASKLRILSIDAELKINKIISLFMFFCLFKEFFKEIKCLFLARCLPNIIKALGMNPSASTCFII